MMRSIAWTAYVLNVLTVSTTITTTMAQKTCKSDADCQFNEYCYSTSNFCVEYFNCNHVNRMDSYSVRARSATQCGNCIDGYSSVKTQDGEADSCVKSDSSQINDGKNIPNNSLYSISEISIAIATITVALIFGYFCWHRLRQRCADNKQSERLPTAESVVIEMPTRPAASAPPSSPYMNKDKYKDEAEKKLLSKFDKYKENVAVDKTRPLKAQGYHPPHYISRNQNYSPDDGQDNFQNQSIVLPQPDNYEEETMSSDWTPSSPRPIESHPFRAITEEQADYSANDAIDRLACPLPSTSQEDRENRDNNNNGPGNSAGGTDNARGNFNSNALSLNLNIVQNYFCNGDK